jgi:WD40 repeat protein
MERATKVFLSYGHDEYAAFAERLKLDLEESGFKVWFDLDRLRPGGDWEQYIEQGLRWLTESPTRGRVVLLMTPHSVRRPDGYCLNEISRADGLRVPIIPVMVQTCEPPLSICRIQWLDMRDTLSNLERNTGQYSAKLQRLIEAIEADALNMEGGQARLTRVLNPLPFEAELALQLRREWLLTRVDSWVNDESGSRILRLSGPLGIGKTSIACWLAVNRPDVFALHLCRHDHAEKSDPRRMVVSIAFQLASQIPAYSERLQLLPLEELILAADARTLFDRLLVQPLSGDFPEPDSPRLIIIDALDEAAHGTLDDAIDIWSSEFVKTPRWLRLLVTSLPEAAIENAFASFAVERLDTTSDQNREDIREFVESQLRQVLLKTRHADDAVQSIVNLSEGIFLYAAQVVYQIVDGHLSLDRADQLPRGVGGIIQSLFARQFPDERYYATTIRPLLEVIAAAMEPLTIDLVAQMFARNEHEINSFVTSLGGLFQVVRGCLQPFHKAVIEWCTDRIKAGRYFVSVKSGHGHLAESGWREYERGPEVMGDYALIYLPVHLLDAGELEQLQTLLTDLWYAMVKSRRRSSDALMKDYDRACAAMGSMKSTTELKIWRSFLRERLHILRRADKLWPEDRILLQLAIEHADSSPVTRAAEAVLASGKCDWVWLRSLEREAEMIRNPCVHVFEGHQTGEVNNGIYGVMRASNGTLVSWASDCTIRTWEVDSGRRVHVLEAHQSAVLGLEELDGRLLAWSNESVTLWRLQDGSLLAQVFLDDELQKALHLGGGRLVCGCADGVVRMISIVNGGPITELHGHNGRVDGLRVLSDGRLLTWSADRTLRIWQLESGESNLLQGHQHGINIAAEVPGKCVISGSYDNTLCVWPFDQPFSPIVLRGHTSTVSGIKHLSNDLLLSWGDDTLRLWRPEDGVCIGVMQGHRRGVLGAIELPNRRLLSWSFDYTLRLWDIDTGRPISVIAFGESQMGTAPSVRLLNNGRVATLGGDGDIRIWDLDVGELVKNFYGHTSACTRLLELDDDRFITASEDNTLRLWSMATSPATVASRDLKMNAVGAIALSSEQLLCWSAEGEMELWNVQDGKLEVAFCGHANAVRGALPLEGGGFLSWSDDGTLRVWNSHARSLKRLSGHSGGVAGVVWLGDGRLLSWGVDCRLRVWETRFGTCIAEFDGHLSGNIGGFLPHKVNGALVLRQGYEAVSWGTDSTLRIWNIMSGESRATMGAHTQAVSGALQCDYSTLLSWGSDGDLYLWEIETGEVRHRLQGHEESVEGAALLENGKCASWSMDGTIRVWDRLSGKCTAIMAAPDEGPFDRPFGNFVQDVAVLRDGTLVAWYQDKHVRRWSPGTGALVESISVAEAFRTRPEWISARRGVWTFTEGNYVAWTNGRRLGISSNRRDGMCSALWDADAEMRPVHLHPSGLVATVSLGQPIRFFALHHGNRRIALSDLDALTPRRVPVDRATPSQPEQLAGVANKRRKDPRWVSILDRASEMLAESFTKRGFDFAKAGNYVRALEDFDQAIRLNPQRYDALFYRGHAQFDLANREGALSDLGRAIELAPDAVAIRCFRARVLLSTGEPKKALDDLDEAIRINKTEAGEHQADDMREVILRELR